jgi:very-short-patch-repair endonuclease
MGVLTDFSAELDQSNADFSRIKEDWTNWRSKQLRISFKELKAKYEVLSDQLSKAYPQAISRTNCENKFYQDIRNHTKLKPLRSVWIGSFNFDFLFYQIQGGSKARGLVIEIDGSIHNLQLKMSKDQVKYELLRLLGICITSVNNEDIIQKSSTIKKIIQDVGQLKRLETRERRRLLKSIYLITLMVNLKSDAFKILFKSVK